MDDAVVIQKGKKQGDPFLRSNFTPTATPKRRLFFCMTVILFLYASSETLQDYEVDQSDDSSLKNKKEQLLSKILNLESSIDERSCEINLKDERNKQLFLRNQLVWPHCAVKFNLFRDLLMLKNKWVRLMQERVNLKNRLKILKMK